MALPALRRRRFCSLLNSVFSFLDSGRTMILVRWLFRLRILRVLGANPNAVAFSRRDD
jgi:hypothetical protein